LENSQFLVDYSSGGGWRIVFKGNGLKLQAAIAAAKTHDAVLLIAKLDRLARNVHFITGLQESTVFSSEQGLITYFLKSH
jgi:hypothetical protein